MNYRKADKKELSILMTAGCLLGILCFAVIYGFKIVDFTYDGWLFNGDMDLRQHYVGFCHYRMSPWRFPIGLIDSLSVPYSMSVVYTDSIPLFAFIFKLFSGVLPTHFQYFGLFGLLCYMLMGMLSPVLIRRFTDNKIICLLGSLFFTVNFSVLFRMFYHTALSAQWIIILALIIWFYTDITDKSKLGKIAVIWALMGILCVGIHSYFVFMTGIILMAQVVEGLISSCDRFRDIPKKLKMIIPILAFMFTSFVTLYSLGGFYGKGSVSGDGFGSFNGNLSAYVNSLNMGTILNGFELNGPFEFEGFAYVGAGILLILLAMLVYDLIISPYILKNERGSIWNRIKNSSVRKKIIFFLVVFVILISCFPGYSFGSVKIIRIPVPGFLQRLLGICRTNGRFVWIGMYLIILTALYFISRYWNRKAVKILFAIALLIQMIDLSGRVMTLHNSYSEKQEFNTPWTDLEAYDVIDGKEEFVFMYDANDIMMDTAFYAYMHGMSQNSFYYARTIYDEIDETIEEWTDEFLSGNLDDSVIYIFRDEDYTNEFKEAADKSQATIHTFDGHVIVTK